ncbi:hypothetical protein WJ60_06365 [Burkholderia ubonensis]|uniref:InvB/SpaK family type III secretion system chaperone n=1 Tax=Burkholderia ubonensis TaxID=101571 RepID=UPI00075CD854|nr:hypothetical protein [Burkholderia ubonensis]KVM73933.1 hypothetical protein WJ60_06365 [Burkholderia ubonensis]
MNVDVVALIRESMEKMGCGHTLAEDLDAHSPICIRFESMPAMYVEEKDGHITLWSKLNYTGYDQVSRTAVDLLDYLLPRGSEIFVGSRPLLSLVEESLLLHGRIEDRFALDIDEFSRAMEAFYEDLCAITEILDR